MKTILKVKVIPKASRNEIVGFEDNVLKVKLTAAPEKGKANQALIDLLSKKLKIPKSKITIIRGATSSLKTLEIDGVDAEDIFRNSNNSR